ncbi:hypothetical protein GF406_25245 [candidate division KSB1 bacterium]|nr:hypothetical protein [candidate division KSB1 bacterium]
MKKELIECQIQAIDLQDETFRLYPDPLEPHLLQSIRKIGLIQPLFLQKKDNNQFRIVDGFKRLKALSELGIGHFSAFVTDHKDDVQIFKTGIEYNHALRSYHAMEIAGLIQKAEHHFHLHRATVIREFFPLLGFGANPQVYELYAPLSSLDPDWQQALRTDQVSLEVAGVMVNESPETRQQFLRWINIMRLNKNQQRDFWQLLLDVARKSQCSVDELARQSELEAILQPEKLTPSQKAGHMKKVLLQKRYPRFHEHQTHFDELIKNASLPENVSMRTDSYFESGQLQILWTVREINEYKNALNKFDELLQSGFIHNLLESL